MSAERLVLWRHGRTASNAEGRFQGQLDVPADEVGLEQARVAAEGLAVHLAGVTSAIVSSPLSRAWVTAGMLAERMDQQVVADPDLMEISMGSWEGYLSEEIAERYPADFAAWRAGEDVPIGGGERRSECAERAERAIVKHSDAMAGGVLVVVSHGGALAGALHRLLQLDGASPRLFRGLGNAHWAMLSPGRDGWQVARYNVSPAAGALSPW